MAGYFNYSMSNNAMLARREGKLPLSEAAREVASKLKITQKKAREILGNEGPCEYHHTSKHYNVTNFYDVPEIVRAQVTYDELTKAFGEGWRDKFQEYREAWAWKNRPDDCRAYRAKHPDCSVVVFCDDDTAVKEFFGDNPHGKNWLYADNLIDKII